MELSNSDNSCNKQPIQVISVETLAESIERRWMLLQLIERNRFTDLSEMAVENADEGRGPKIFGHRLARTL